MLDFNSSTQLSQRLNSHVDKAIVKDRSHQPKRDYLGGSRLGVECERALQFEYFHTPKEEGKDFSGKTYRIFERGHWVEDACIKWMKLAGVDIRTHKKDGSQFGFSTLSGKIQGHCDGVIIGGNPDFGPFPRLWECKGIQEKYWNSLVKKKVKEEYPVYYGQMQVYMAYLQLTDNPALFTAINMNTMEIYWESVKFDTQEAQALSDKGVRVVQACEAGELLPRISSSPEFFKCKWCGYTERCYGLNC